MTDSRKKLLYRIIRSSTEFLFAKKKHFCDRFSTKPTKIKLVAIAKNEAAYLPEWIFHHLYFGFDHIEIHVNRTSDNTISILSEVAKLPNVSLKNADAFFDSYNGNPQPGLYKRVLTELKNTDFTHVFFIDIDEFWTPLDLSTSIYDCVQQSGKFDVMSFEWLNRVEPHNAFGRAISESVDYQRAEQVKSIIDVSCPAFRVNPHTLVNPYLNYIKGDGTELKPQNEAFSRIPKEDLKKPLKPFFIIHRYYRSEMEYIATLGRGRPKFPEEGVTKIKGNRKGYASSSNLETIVFSGEPLKKYQAFMESCYNKYIDQKEYKIACDYVESFYSVVLTILKNSEVAEKSKIQRAFTNIKDPLAIAAINTFHARHR